jgi:alkanesulfonate monooxygenase SsuD/methylene tetrahydromethanopterin reductase-like flavin-dependent oxidoreductase (luciferase family)
MLSRPRRGRRPSETRLASVSFRLVGDPNGGSEEVRMVPLSDGGDAIKVVHHYGVGMHAPETDPDFHDASWQQRQIADFVAFAAEAEQLGYDGITLTEHHVLSTTCPSPHLLLAAAAAVTSTIRLGTAVTTLPLYNPIRLAEEVGTLDLLSGGRFELGLGRGFLPEAELVIGRPLDEQTFARLWSEGLELFEIALTTRDFTFEGEFWTVPYRFTVPTRPLQDPLPIWIGSRTLSSAEQAAERGWNLMRNFGAYEEHRDALDHYVRIGAEHGHSLSGANMLVERFVVTGGSPSEVQRNYDRVVSAFTRFFAAMGRNHPHEPIDPAVVVKSMAITGTPDEVTDELDRLVGGTGARRILIETFSNEEMRLFAREVLPALKRPRADLHPSGG